MALNPDRFAIVWRAHEKSTGFCIGCCDWYRLYSKTVINNGSVSSSITLVDGDCNDQAPIHDAHILPTNQFLVVWNFHFDSWGYFPHPPAKNRIWGRIRDMNGSPFSTMLQFNTYTTTTQRIPQIELLDEQRLAVIWVSDQQDGDQKGIFGLNGQPLSSEFRVNVFTTDNQKAPQVIPFGKDFFWVIGQYTAGPSISASNIFGAVFDSQGNRQGEELRLNIYLTSFPMMSRVESIHPNRFVVTWGYIFWPFVSSNNPFRIFYNE